MLALLLLACTPEPSPTSNPFPDRAVARPATCADGPAVRLQVTLPQGALSAASHRLAWRASPEGAWQEVGRWERGNAVADLPGGGELTVLGLGEVVCGSVVEERGGMAPLVSVMSRAWSCARDVRVLGPDGAPAAGAEVWVGEERRGQLRGELVGWADADGWARAIPVPCSPAAVGAVVGGVGVWGELGEEAVSTVTVPEPAVRLHGRVRSGDEPVVGAKVALAPLGVTDQPGEGLGHVSVWTDADGRWSAGLVAPLPPEPRVVFSVDAEGFLPVTDVLPVAPGDDLARFADLTPARTVHLRCVGRPDDSCDVGRPRVACGAPGELWAASVDTTGPRGQRQLSVRCPDAPDLRLSLDGEEVPVYDDVAWFDRR